MEDWQCLNAPKAGTKKVKMLVKNLGETTKWEIDKPKS